MWNILLTPVRTCFAAFLGLAILIGPIGDECTVSAKRRVRGVGGHVRMALVLAPYIEGIVVTVDGVPVPYEVDEQGVGLRITRITPGLHEICLDHPSYKPVTFGATLSRRTEVIKIIEFVRLEPVDPVPCSTHDRSPN